MTTPNKPKAAPTSSQAQPTNSVPATTEQKPPYSTDRKELLLKMYDQMFNDINRQLTVVWQSIAVLIGAFAVFALAEKQIITTDYASTLIILISGWSMAHLFDAAYWYNRNLVIIANIERQFLSKQDLGAIHYYFGKHRPNNKMITQLRIQFALSAGIVLFILFFHLVTRVFPGIGAPNSKFELPRVLPYIALVAVGLYLISLKRNRDASYKEFIQNSPGISVATEGVSYGVGHGFKKN